ncbi:unnamed protein product, partial [Mesorhabditis belari]|uniref:Uncharacterized protein n=1 Tax=Mesorhabditis belari TaxID=2138241 RepID=A0AAF3EVU9_9BILA
MSTCSEGRLALENGQKEINIMVSHQLALIRAREQELLQQLDQITSMKETILNQQQEMINQNIGACQLSLDTVRQRGDEGNEGKNSEFRLGTVDLSPRENSYVALEADFMKMRLFLTEFGKLVTTNEAERPGESLPHELEEYDDAVPMVHKSVMRLSGSQSVPSQLKSQAGNIPASHTIHNWLAKMPSGQNVLETDMDALMKEYEEVTTRARDRLDSFNASTITSSFEVLNGNGKHSRSANDSPIPVVSDAMKENLGRPMNQWLLQKERKSPEKSESMKRKVILEEHPNNKVSPYEFEMVINEVKASDNSKWLLRDAASQTESTLRQTSSSASLSTSAETLLPNVPSNTPYDASGYSTPCTSTSAPLPVPFGLVFPKFFSRLDSTVELAKQMKKCVFEAETPSGFDEERFLQNIREILLTPPEFTVATPKFEIKTQTPQNSPSDDSDMRSIDGWKKILDQNHQAMDTTWLAGGSNCQ